MISLMIAQVVSGKIKDIKGYIAQTTEQIANICASYFQKSIFCTSGLILVSFSSTFEIGHVTEDDVLLYVER